VRTPPRSDRSRENSPSTKPGAIHGGGPPPGQRSDPGSVPAPAGILMPPGSSPHKTVDPTLLVGRSCKRVQRVSRQQDPASTGWINAPSPSPNGVQFEEGVVGLEPGSGGASRKNFHDAK